MGNGIWKFVKSYGREATFVRTKENSRTKKTGAGRKKSIHIKRKTGQTLPKKKKKFISTKHRKKKDHKEIETPCFKNEYLRKKTLWKDSVNSTHGRRGRLKSRRFCVRKELGGKRSTGQVLGGRGNRKTVDKGG